MAAKPNDDPALAMCTLWQRDADHLDEVAKHASQRERAAFDADPANEQEARRLYLAAAGVQDRCADKLQRFTQAIFQFKAQTFEGIAAKLAVAIRDCAPSPTIDQEPWPYLRSVQADLDRLVADGAIQPPANDDEVAT